MARVTVTSAADATLLAAGAMKRTALIKNKTNTASVYLEIKESTVSSSTSYEWEVDDGPISFDVTPGWTLLAKSAGADQIVHILASPA